MTATRPPGFNRPRMASRNRSSSPISSLTGHAQRLKRARGGVVPGLGPPCRRIGTLHKSRQFPGGFDGLAHPRLHDGPRDTPGLRIFTVAFDDVLQILKLGPIHKAAHRQFLGITVHAHIEGPSELKLKPRSAESIWSEETPMSMRAPSTASQPIPSSAASNSL